MFFLIFVLRMTWSVSVFLRVKQFILVFWVLWVFFFFLVFG